MLSDAVWGAKVRAALRRMSVSEANKWGAVVADARPSAVGVVRVGCVMCRCRAQSLRGGWRVCSVCRALTCSDGCLTLHVVRAHRRGTATFS